MVEARQDCKSLDGSSRVKLVKRSSEAQLYILPTKLKSATSSPSTLDMNIAGKQCNTSLSSPGSSSSSLAKPSLPIIQTKFKNRPRAHTTLAFAPQLHTTQPCSAESTTRYWVLQQNTPLSISNNDANYLSDSTDEEELNSYTEVYKENCYPNGPLLVYPPNIYLYSEPSLPEVLEYDFVINVAKEINNQQTKLPLEKQSKYHHFAWTHTCKIVDNLPRITEMIHNSYLRGEKILVHCQCGVSRSASLIVAYMMRYDNLNLNDAYNKLKTTAKDISPNMSLLFQLMEWEDWLKNYNHINTDYEMKSHNLISEFREMTL